jgi:DNA-directed RNA polymerase specialized sigma24 family protein
MSKDSRGSVTLCIGDLKAGGDAAAQLVWERYFEQLVRLAAAQMRKGHRRPAFADEEDAVLSAFDSFCQGVRQNSFPQLADRGDLWRVLVVITRRKLANQERHERAQRRGGHQVVHEADLLASGEDCLDFDQGGPLRFRGSLEVPLEPTPEFAAELAEECRLRLAGLSKDELRQVAILKMEGYTDDEVAERLGCTRRSVQRKLALIRDEWRGAVS